MAYGPAEQFQAAVESENPAMQQVDPVPERASYAIVARKFAWDDRHKANTIRNALFRPTRAHRALVGTQSVSKCRPCASIKSNFVSSGITRSRAARIFARAIGMMISGGVLG